MQPEHYWKSTLILLLLLFLVFTISSILTVPPMLFFFIDAIIVWIILTLFKKKNKAGFYLALAFAMLQIAVMVVDAVQRPTGAFVYHSSDFTPDGFTTAVEGAMTAINLTKVAIFSLFYVVLIFTTWKSKPVFFAEKKK